MSDDEYRCGICIEVGELIYNHTDTYEKAEPMLIVSTASTSS